jgi:cellulose synthase operon protein C
MRLGPLQAAASAGYRSIVARRGTLDDREWASWLSLATRARADSLILGAQIWTQRLDGDPPAEQLAAATRDPWFERAVDIARARATLRAGRIEQGEVQLSAIRVHCPAGETSYRCLDLAVALAGLALDRHQPQEAKRQALLALSMSRQLHEWPQRAQALILAGDAERFGGNFGAARAYLEEAGRSRDVCGARDVAFALAEMMLDRHRLEPARVLAAAAPTCNRAPGTVELTTLVRLLRTGHAVLDRAAVEAKIVEAREALDTARDAAYLDYLAAWLALDDHPAARERLVRVAESAHAVEGAMRQKTLVGVAGALFIEATGRAAWAEALAIVARAQGVAPPLRCALAFAADEEFRFAAVMVGPGGELIGRYEQDVARTDEWLAPAFMRQALAGCDDVAVLSLPPWVGTGPVLDSATPWHYVLGPMRQPITGPRRHVVVFNPTPPPSARLRPLAPRVWPEPPGGPDVLLTGSEATPERVLTEIADATVVEIHSHATWLDRLDAPVLALSPGADGWTLGAARIRTSALSAAPVVVLADCTGGASARFNHETWGLPLAFRRAGASAVIASLAPIPDRDASAFFDLVTMALATGTSPARAVARARAEKMRSDPTSWVRHVVVFQ